ncbi:MAG: endonuclease [Verrucomicrobia bacterium]|nr:MAG: endonuclease [Verrucomicrobiota bacterium]
MDRQGVKNEFLPRSDEGEGRAHQHSRRRFLTRSAAAAVTSFVLPGSYLLRAAEKDSSKASTGSHRYKVAVCDWMILKRQKLGAYQLARDIGADGVEVDMGSLGERETFDNQLARPEVRRQFLDKARELNLEICSLAMSGFYAQSFAERRTVQRMVKDCIDTLKAMNLKVAFLPLGVRGDLVKQAGVIIGLETALSAAEEVKLLEDVGSPAVRSYFNFANALKAGRDLHAELRARGKDYLCQIHCTDEDGVLLQDNQRLDLRAVKGTLDEMGWSGWLVIERSRDVKDARNVKRNFGANAAYVKSVFQTG